MRGIGRENQLASLLLYWFARTFLNHMALRAFKSEIGSMPPLDHCQRRTRLGLASRGQSTDARIKLEAVRARLNTIS
jgi:hypothetical protein